MLAPRCNKRECSVRLYEDDGCESTFSEHRGPPSPGAPLALKHPQGCDEVPVMVKTECDGDGAIAYQVLHTDQTQLGEHSETEGGLLVKEEDHSAVNAENETYEVMIKQELDIGATMLQPKTKTCSLTPSTSWTCPYSEVSPSDPLPHRRDDVYPNVLQERSYDNSGSEHSSMGIQDGSQSGYFVASQAGFDCIAEATDNTNITYEHGGREMHKTKVCNSEIHTQPHTIYECKYCEHKSTDFREFERHGRVHVYAKPFKCDRCEYRSSREDGLTRHMRTHTGDKPFKCEYCEYRSSELVHLKRHIRTHTGERPYKCEHCEYTASQSGGLKRHMYIHTGEKPYKCDQCEYSTYTRTYLKRHTRTHIVVKPYKCEQCEYRAPDVGGLKIHMYTHTADKPFKCKCCEYSTSRSDSLTRHMRTHTGEKPYRCEQCQYSAPELGSLKRHMHIHTGDKPLKCEHCEYSTSRANCMTRHMRIHTGEKPYKCQVCEYSGSQRGHLQKHMRRHMNDTLMS